MPFPGVCGVLSVVGLALSATPSVGPARVVKDINRSAGPETFAWPQGFVELDEFTVFVAYSAETGFEPWSTDGTEAGTRLLKDINRGKLSSVAARSQVSNGTFLSARVGGVVCFPASDGMHGLELWRSDGTEEGTFLLADIAPGLASGLQPSFEPAPIQLAEAGNLLYFPAADPAHGMELWRTDGTQAGTFRVTDLTVGSLGSVGGLMSAVVGSNLFFVGNDFTHGPELWMTNGSAGRAVRLTDLPAGGGIYRLGGDVGGVLLFSAYTNPDLELWRSDGTEAGTFLVKDIRPGPVGSDPWPGLVMNGALYFTADDGEHGEELWKSDGTPEGTVLLRDIRTGPASSLSYLSVKQVCAGKLYFVADDGTHGQELWVTDGTGEGTHLVREIVPGPNPSLSFYNFTQAGSTLYFVVNDTVHGPEIWTTDGTEQGTRLVTNLLATYGPEALIPVGERLFYVRGESVHGVEPWATDGSDGGRLLADVYPGPQASFSFASPGKRGNAVLFSADDGVHGMELWRTDGTPEGTRLLKNLNPLERTSPSTELDRAIDLGGRLLFFAADSLHGLEPWITDGTEEGTALVKDIFPGRSGSGQEFSDSWARCARVGSSGIAVFAASDSLHGSEPWASDGREGGTHLLKDLWPGGSGSSPLFFTAVGARVVFTAFDGVGQGLWATDGTASGTHLLGNIALLGGDSDFVPFQDALYFVASQVGSGRSLWRTDGTESGTFPVADVGTGYTASPVVYRGALWLITGDSVHGGGLWRSDGTEAGTSRVADLAAIESYELTAVGDRLFFAGYTDANGVQLWISDGTGPGTRPLSEPGVEVGKLTAVGDSLFFLGIDLEHGGELWKSDGTETGTGLVKDIWQGGEFDGWPTQLASVDGILLFTADDPEHGRELWRSDGTEGGTFLVQDLLPGREGSSPGALVRAGDRVFFSATDDAAGREPWVGRSSILTGQPMLALRDLADEVRGLGLPIGTERSLTAKLDAAGLALARPGGASTATRLLAAFVQELQASSALIPPAALNDRRPQIPSGRGCIS